MSNEMKAPGTLLFGAGRGEILLPQEYFENYDAEGNLRYEDGFTGAVHVFNGAKGPIKDSPMIRVMLLESGRRVAIVSMEIAQAPEDQIQYTRKIVNSVCGVPMANIWVHSTHQFGFMHRPHDAKKSAIYDDAMKAAVKAASEEAIKALRPAYIGIGTGESRVGANKNITAPNGIGGGPYYGPGSTLETNPVMTVLRFEDAENGALLGFYMSYGTKPSTLLTTGQKVGNRELNSELTGQACKRMEEAFGVPCVTCMPAAGDQYPRETAMFYGLDEAGNWRIIDLGFEKGIQIVDKLGAELAADAMSVAEKITCGPRDTAIQIAAGGFRFLNKSGDAEITIPVEAITIGDIAFVGLRQETDCLTELQLTATSPYSTTLLVTFLNGDGKYMSHWEAYDFNNGVGTWESARSAFSRGAAERFVEVAVRMLSDMKAGRKIEAVEAPPATVQNSAYVSRLDFGGHRWYVLDRKEDKVLLLSEGLLGFRPYHDEDEPVTWESSSLRRYLNGEFLSSLPETEKARVLETQVVNRSNPKYAIRGGEDTLDKVFLLSLEEAELYLSGFGNLLTATDAEGRAHWWHLRSPGEAENVAAGVTAGGMIDYHGVSEAINTAMGGLRPALWVRV